MTSNADQVVPAGHWRDVKVLIVEGAMAADFLQGYLTCDTLKLQPGQAQPAAICNVKGRVLANGWAVQLAQGIGLVIHASRFEAAAEFLTPYVTFSKCDLRAAPLFVMTNTPAADIHLLPGVRLALVENAASTEPDVSTTMQALLVDAEIALVSTPVSEAFLPQMLALDRIGAVDFDKGCYLGQEIVARAQFRGEVKRQLVKFKWQDTPPAVGDTTPARETIINVAGNGVGLKVARA